MHELTSLRLRAGARPVVRRIFDSGPVGDGEPDQVGRVTTLAGELAGGGDS